MAYMCVMTLTKFVNRWYQRNVTRKSLLGQMIRKGRRFYLGTFQAKYVRHSVAETRDGECKRCGKCCALILNCPFLGHDHHEMPYCRVYGGIRPANCKVYPFDAIDSEVATCGYRFSEKRKTHPHRNH